MKKTWSKPLALCLAVLMVLSSVPLVGVADFDWGITAKAVDGYCGENVTYTYDSKTGEVVISGEGDMYDYDQYDNISPFYETDIKTVVIEDGVTSIGADVFYDCTSLTSITIPDSVTTIGDRAFDSCESLTSITIPDSVTAIGDSAFYDCINLTSVTIPDSVTAIGDSAFERCRRLTSVTIPDSVTTIGNWTFSCCFNLTSVTIPDSVTSIGLQAFRSCNSLTSVTIPDSVKTIGVLAFESCESLTSVTIGGGVTTIADSAFESCESLTSITIPDSVKTIGWAAFRDCSNLSDITIGNGVTSIRANAFYATKYYTTVSNWDIDEALYIGNYLIKVKPHDDKYAVKEDTVVIAGEALRGLDVRVVYIPDTVKNIGREAFLYCNNLKYVYFGGTEEEWSAVEIDGGNDCLINASSYYYSHEHTPNDGTVAKEPNCKEDGEKRARCIFCEALLIEKIPASHTEIAVSGKPATCTVPGYTDSSYCEVCGETIKASEEISTIPHTDEDSNGICDVCNNYMDDVESLGYCGENKEDAEYILYKDGTLVISGTGAIDSSCFYGWSNIKKVVINEGIKKIGESCFNNCSELVEVSLPSTLEEIGDSAFANCSKLMGLNIPDSVTKVGQNILANTSWHHNQPIGLLTLDGWILGYKGTMPESYTLPIGKDIKGMAEEFILRWEINDFDLEEENLYYTYEDGVLYNKDKTVLIRVSLQNSYSEFIVPDTVKTIGANAFQKNNGRRVVLPATLENIENNAFLNAGLTNLDIPASVKKLGHASLFNVTNVYYPGTLEQWQAIEGSERAIADNTSLFLNHTHSYAEPVLERDNCENYGNLVYNCIHGDFYSLVALPTEHIWEDEYTVETEATCTSQGYKYIKCSECEVTKNHEWFYEEHSWSDWTTVAPNCDEWNDGYDIRTCSACGAEETANYVSPSHSWSDWTTVAPDCDEWNDGYDIRTCSGCGTEETANYISPEHSWSDWTEVEGDCSQDKWGYYERTCFGCGEKDITSEIAPECHYVEIFTPATTSSSGEITTKCEKCGDIADYEYIPQITYIELSSTTVTYNGNIRTPSIVVRNDYGQRLTEGLSYNYEYLDGDMVNPGVYRVKVSFKGRYAGEEILSFTILPGKTKNFFATTTYTSAELKWDAVEGADVYRIYQTFDGETKLIATTADTTYKVKNLAPASTYRFSVQAGTAYGASNEETETTTQPTTYIETTTKPTTTMPTTTMPTTQPTTQPTSVTTTAPTTAPTTMPTTTAIASRSITELNTPVFNLAQCINGRVTLGWNFVPGATGYAVYISTSAEGSFKRIEDTATTRYSSTGLKEGITYYFKVKAYSEVGGKTYYSDASETLAITATSEFSEVLNNSAPQPEDLYLWGDTVTITCFTTGASACDHLDENADRICDICEEETLRFAGNYNNTVFKLYTDGTLIISGYGTAYCRWQNYREFIKKVIVEEGITALGSGCLAMCLNMEDVSLPATLEAIYDEAFYSCESLTEIEIPERVEYLGNSVFSGCNSLESLTIPEGIAELRYYFASGCAALEEVNLPSTIEALGDGVFADCTALETIDLPEGLVRISGAFKNCTALKEIDFPASLEAISYEAFRNCDALAEVSFPENLREIGYAAFCDCDSLTEIEIPATVENVEYLAFANCTSLKKVKSAARNLLESTFSGCSNLEEAELLEGTETIGWGVFSNCGKLSKVSLPDTVTTIEGYAFSECFALEEIDIPDAVEFLSYNTFYRCHNLKKVDLGNIKGIDSEAFADCIRLEEITLDGNVEAVYRGAFKNCIRLKKVTIENPACDIASYIDTFPEKTVIYGYEDSTAQKYAVDWMRNFVSLGGEHTHRYNEAVTVEPTCTEKGVKTFTCSCGRSYTEEIAALGHNEITLNATAATCTTSGLTEGKSCQRCQEILIAQQTIPEAGHNMAISEELSVAPTCKDAGKSVKVCTTCGAKEETTLPADANAHKIEWTSVTATCTQKGSRTGKCSVCQKTETQEIPALGHDIADGEWVVVNAATCSTQGDKVAVCNRCRATIKEKIPTVAHKDANSDNKCDVCGATVKEPTPTEPPKPTDPTQPSQPDTPDNPADECDCGCHKDGIAGFFFRFILFFQKLFGANETCQCGEAHY